MSSDIKPCPFCGASPHRGAVKRTGFQDGSENQDYRIWCPHLCAQMERSNEGYAVAAWNRRAPTGGRMDE